MSPPLLPPPNVDLQIEETLDGREVRFAHHPHKATARVLRVVCMLGLGVFLGLGGALAGFSPSLLAGLLALALLVEAPLRWLGRRQVVRIRVTPTHLRWDTGEGEQSILLEDIVQVRAIAAALLAQRREGPSQRILSNADAVLVEWLAVDLSRDVARRRKLLTDAGHDLDVAAAPPEALLHLVRPPDHER